MSKLRFDGYYYNLNMAKNKFESTNYILRFFPENNKVIGINYSINKENKFNFANFFPSYIWLDENYKDSGTFTINENKINFECGKNKYKGATVNEDIIELNNKDKNNFRFISFEVLKDTKILEGINYQ